MYMRNVVKTLYGAAKRHERARLLNDVGSVQTASVAANNVPVADYQLQQTAVSLVSHGTSVGTVWRLSHRIFNARILALRLGQPHSSRLRI